MEKQEFINELRQNAKKINIELSNKQIEQFYEYMILLLEWNQKINLTAITEPKDIILKHFIDSLTLIPYLEENKNILDIGTGAGFPGIPLKIVKENANFVLLDSLNKRITFLKTIIENLKLYKIQAIHGRAEEFINQNKQREQYDIVVSRAVAKLNVLLEYMLPFVKIGGLCICMKSTEIKDEIEEANKAIEILGGKIEKIDIIALPNSEIERKIILIKKIKNTPNKFPRKVGTPTKDPII